MNKICQVSTFFKIFFQVIFIALPFMQIIGWIKAPTPVSFLNQSISYDVIPQPYTATVAHASQILHPLTLAERLAGFGVSLIPLSIQLFILYSLIKLFSLYAEGKIFSTQNVKHIQHIGYSLLLGQIVNCFYQGIMGVILTWNNPHGHRFAAITLDQTNMGILLVAFLVILISWIMAEGCKLHEEQQLTV